MSILSFIYPRRVSVFKPVAPDDMSYSEYELAADDLVDLPASIQLASTSSVPDTGSPTDASHNTYWKIFIPFPLGKLSGVIANGLIVVRYVIQDDLGIRYEVVGHYWNSLGYNLRCKQLTA